MPLTFSAALYETLVRYLVVFEISDLHNPLVSRHSSPCPIAIQDPQDPQPGQRAKQLAKSAEASLR